MSITTLKKVQTLKNRYNREDDDFVESFFNPCLATAVNYYRAAGFFSSSSLITLAAGIRGLLANGGHMCLVTSPMLSSGDIKAIKAGLQKREDVIVSRMTNVVNEVDASEWSTQFEALAWMIASGRLEIKIAISPDGGIYHDKLGIIEDATGDFVAFSGSLNEGALALEQSFESFDVDFSWEPYASSRAFTKKNEFDRLWGSKLKKVELFNLPDAVKKSILQVRRDQSEEEYLARTGKQNSIKLPNGKQINLYDHQKNVLKSWRENDYQGTFKMCTGAGKTITALSGILRLQEELQKGGQTLSTVVVACPTQVLVEQWRTEILEFGFPVPLLAYDDSQKYFDVLRSYLINRQPETRFVVTTYDSIQNNYFRNNIRLAAAKVNSNVLLIADEVHNFYKIDQLPNYGDYFNFRIGLSATPEIEGNPEATERLFNFYGKILEPQYELSQAIQDKVLTPYNYFPVPVFLSGDVAKQYAKVLAEIDSQHTSGNIDISLYNEKRSILDHSGLQFEALKNIVTSIGEGNVSNLLVYCQPGKPNGSICVDETDEEITKLNLIVDYFQSKGIAVSSITAKTGMAYRPQILRNFASGEIKVLLGISCLDEGLNVPSISTAIMLHSIDRERQFVQRRGRILRKSKGKDLATIYDIIILPQGAGLPDTVMEKIIKKELRRYTEFAELAQNRDEAVGILEQALTAVINH